MKCLPLYLVLAAGVLVSACKDNPTTSPDQIPGNYKTTRYIMPGPTDGPDSVHLRGAFVEVSLKDNGTLNGRSSSPVWGTPTDTVNFTGTYTIRNDSVFIDTEPATALEMGGWYWMEKEDLVLRRQGLGPMYIYLDRQ